MTEQQTIAPQTNLWTIADKFTDYITAGVPAVLFLVVAAGLGYVYIKYRRNR